jgi:YHYH protein
MKTKAQIPDSSNLNRAKLMAALAGGLCALAVSIGAADPRTDCWFTADSGQYARIYTNEAMKSAGTTLTTWSNGSQTQSLPVYCGVQEVYSSTNWIYVRSTGLASYNMGPWFLNAGRTMEFPNLPVNQKLLFRFPRTNGVPKTKSLTGAGEIGIFVDGVEMFNSWDAHYWNGSADVGYSGTDGYWNRDAYMNEGVTFDAGYAHQQQNGTFHYHADPIALRYELGDHVDYNPATKTYSEDTNPPTHHSPILAWTADGYPLYGPYGYSNATNASSGIRRMVSGYVPRNGQNGTDNLDYNGAARPTIPAWAQRAYGVAASQSGPTVSSSYPFGRYMEDNAYLGDLTNPATGSNYQQGVDFDLDEYNGRWCVTPEFPNGTYAYFVAIDSTGTPVYPYNIGRDFYGDPVGGSVSSISEPVVTNFLGNTNLAATLNSPLVKNGTVTLRWSAVEGGTYQVEATTNLSDSSGWTVVASGVSPNETSAGYTNTTSLAQRFYRVGRTSVASFDSAGTTLFNAGAYGILSVSPTSGSRGATCTLTISLDSGVNPPPVNAPINSVTIGAITGTGNLHISQTEVTSSIAIPAGAATGPQTVSVVFPGPPGNPSQTVSYTLTNGFTIY